jgi:predicted GNAT family acetyltransferase
MAMTADEAIRATLDWFEVNSGWAPPDEDTLAEWIADGVCRCPDECLVAPDAWCEHGLASWWLVLGAIDEGGYAARRWRMDDAPPVVDNEDASRFELAVDGHVAELAYRHRGDRLVLLHTGVPDELEGRGLGGVLVSAAVERALQQGLTVVPSCPFARGWLKRHPEVASKVPID